MDLEAVVEAAVRRVLQEELQKLVGPRAVEPLPRLLTIGEAARLLSCSKSKLKGLIRDGVIATTMLGGRRMVPLDAVNRAASATEPQVKTRAQPQRRPLRTVNDEAEALRAQLRVDKRRKPA